MKKVPMSIRAAVCAALAVQSVHAAQAQTVDCMPAKEAEALFLTFGAPLIDQVRKICVTVLPSGSYLSVRGEDLSKRLSAAANGREAEAVAAFKRFGGDDRALDGIDTATLLPLIRSVMAPMFAEEIKERDCSGISAVLATLDPLPAENLVQFVITVAQLSPPAQSETNKRSTKKSAADFNVCPLSTTP